MVGIVVSARRSLVDVVGLQPIAAATASNRADAMVPHPDVTSAPPDPRVLAAPDVGSALGKSEDRIVCETPDREVLHGPTKKGAQ